MRKLFSRSLGVLLSAAMILTSISTPVFAEEIPEGEVEIVQETADDFDLVENEEVSIDEESTVVYEEEIGDVEETEIIEEESEEESEEELIVVESDSEETEEIEEDMLLTDPEPSSPAVIFTLNGEKADLANFLNFTDENVIGADGTILTPDVAITFKIVDGAVPEGKRFVNIQYNDTDFEAPTEDVYSIPASANAGENITVNMITNDILTGVTLEGVSKNAVSLEVGTSKTYTIKRKEAASTDKLEAKPNDDAEGFSVTINEEQTELTVQINETDAANVQGDFVIINKDDESKEIAKFSVSATNPVWTSKTVTASVQLSTDVDIRLTIKPFTTLGSKLYDGNYYYEVKLITPEGALDSTRRMNPAVRYVEPLLDGNTVYFNLQKNISEVPEHPNWVDAEPGEGGSATFNVEVKLVQKKSSVETPTKEDDYFLSTKATKFDASLKVPHYAEKITVKKDKTALLAGECDVKIGTVTFGKNDTYVNNDDWVIQSVTAPNGEPFGTVSEPYSDNIRSVYGVTVYKSTSDITDNGIYVEADSYMIGKYTVTLAARTKDVSGRIPEVKIQFTVNKSISDLSFTGPNLIYKAANKKATAKTAVSAVSCYLNSVTNYNAMSAIKNPKVIYEVGTIDSQGEITPVDGITVDKKGVITIAKDFEVTNTLYAVRVSANEYLGQDVSNEYNFRIKAEAVKVKALEAYLYNGSEYTKITSKTSVPYDSLTSLLFAVKGTDGKYIIGGDGTETDPVDIETIGNGNYGSLGLKIDSSISNKALGALTKPTDIAFTLSSLDGSKAKCAFKIGYAASSDDYDKLQIGQVKMMFGSSKTTIPETGEGAFTYDIPAEWGYNPIIELALSNGETGPYSQAFGTPCISGSLSVQGAKIIVDYQNMAKAEAQMMGEPLDIPCAKNQDIFIQPTKPVVKVTLTKPVYGTDGKMKTIKKQYTINCAASEAPKAPKIKSTMLGVPTGVEGQYTYEKMSRGREYSENEVIEFRLDKPLVLPTGIMPDQVYISFNTVVDMSSAGIPIKAYPITYEMDLDEAGYFVDSDGNACVRMKCSDMVASYLVLPKMNVSLQYAYLDTVNDNKPIYITSTPSQGTVVFNPYKKSFKANATQTLKYIPAEGENPATFEAGSIKGKGDNVKSVAVKKVYSSIVKGSYNDFATVFKVDDSGKLAVASSAYEKLKAEAAIVKNKGVPEARVGYVLCIVTYTDGTTDEVLSKVTVKFSK